LGISLREVRVHLQQWGLRTILASGGIQDDRPCRLGPRHALPNRDPAQIS
jgi:hypothetical protein